MGAGLRNDSHMSGCRRVFFCLLFCLSWRHVLSERRFEIWEVLEIKLWGKYWRLSYGIGFGGTEKEGQERKWASWHAF